MLCFGLVTLCQAFMHNKKGFYAARIFLGISEAVAMPGISYLLTRYYRRSELTLRVGCFMLLAAGFAGACKCFNVLPAILPLLIDILYLVGGLLAAGLLSVGKIGSRKGWQNIFLVGQSTLRSVMSICPTKFVLQRVLLPWVSASSSFSSSPGILSRPTC